VPTTKTFSIDGPVPVSFVSLPEESGRWSVSAGQNAAPTVPGTATDGETCRVDELQCVNYELESEPLMCSAACDNESPSCCVLVGQSSLPQTRLSVPYSDALCWSMKRSSV